MSDWLRRLLDPSSGQHIPTHLTDDYWIFMPDADEEVSAEALIKDAAHTRPGSARLAREAIGVIRETLAKEFTSLEVAVARAAETLAKAKLTSVSPSFTCLIDHSGSMARGDKLPMSLLAVEAISLLALKLDFPCEVLGFTTRFWKGEPLRAIWQGRDRPANPGRLCALRHIVYADYTARDIPYMGAMFLPDILKENIDGEALLWASERARKLDADQHVILVLSDGAPVDDSTLSVNPSTYLMDHLKSVIAEMKDDPELTLFGVGLNYDVSRIYPQSMRLRFPGQVEEELLPRLVELCGNSGN